MHIDEDKKHVLNSIRKTKRGVTMKESDHNTIISEFSCAVTKAESHTTDEFYNLKNKDCQANFKKFTTDTKMFSSIFENKEDDIDQLTNRLIKKINGSIAANFKKRRVTYTKTNTETDKLYDRLRALKGQRDDKSLKELEGVKEAIAQIAENKFAKIKAELDTVNSSTGFSGKQLLKLRKKMCPNSRDPPSAMFDKHGNLLTSDKSIESRALEAYSERLENNEMLFSGIASVVPTQSLVVC